MRAQILLGMLFALAIAAAFALFAAALFVGVDRIYSSGLNSIDSNYANLSNTLSRAPQPYPEFHIINTNG